MKRQNIKELSKFLSLVLRHKPENIGITLSNAGWVDTAELIEKMNAYGKEFNLGTLYDVVENNDKKRFAFNEDRTKIRASQGHSVPIDLAYKEKTPPQILFHGTASRNLESIFQKGLEKRDRHHVHLSIDVETAIKVGQRHGKPKVLGIRASEMYLDGFKFYESENKVWLTDFVPVKYLELQEA